MGIYGYKRSVIDRKHGLLELKEVTFDLTPDDLRRLAAFLQHFAELMDHEDWRSDHAHIENFDPAWRQRQPNTTVVVLNHPPASQE